MALREPPAAAVPEVLPEILREQIAHFVAASGEPCLLEPGDEPMALTPANHALECRAGRLILEAWDATRNLVRRVLGIVSKMPGRLELEVERFGGRKGTLVLADARRNDARRLKRASARLAFRDRFHRFLCRQFPGWKVAELSAQADLEHSLSPQYPRALVCRGASAWAAIGACTGPGNDDGVLTFGLLWLDYLRRRVQRRAVEGLTLFLPEGRELTTCLRLRYLDQRLAQYAVFLHSEDGFEERIDHTRWGNLETQLEPFATVPPSVPAWFQQVCERPEAESVPGRGGALSFRVRGLEFARLTTAGLEFGVDRRREAQPAHRREIETLVEILARVRSPGADRLHPLYQRKPEAWLESQVRRRLDVLDATLLPAPVYGQVLAFAGGERGVLDLLAMDRGGRLVVIELKATADLHLPLQAMDYWMRVEWHQQRGEFATAGYFPGQQLAAAPPRLLLVAPALEFHPSTETILRYFAPAIEVERIGLGVEWQRELRVMFCLRGAQSPC